MATTEIAQDHHLESGTTLGTAVIVGSSGGIGQALVRALVAKARFEHVYCLNRTGQAPSPTHHTAQSKTALIGIQIDLTHEDSLRLAAEQVSLQGPIGLVLVATGLLQDDALSPEKTMRHLSSDALMRAFQINAVGPALVAKHFLPLMRREGRSVFAALSARVGSISDNRSGGWYGYRAAKAALNMLIQTLALEHARKFPLGICIGIHPGTVDTHLSKPFQRGVPSERLFSPDVSAAHILNLIQNLTTADTGGLFAWDGKRIAP
jgi:NAD(P)-dependent dehydrogenase (short-subunit alcohol dehydrogenase family)